MDHQKKEKEKRDNLKEEKEYFKYKLKEKQDVIQKRLKDLAKEKEMKNKRLDKKFREKATVT